MPPRALIETARRFRDTPLFERAVITLIVAAGILIGLETSAAVMERHGPVLRMLDRLVLALFTAEVLVRFVADGARPLRFLRNGWHLFDTIVVLLCYLPETGPFATLARLGRVLRLLHLLESVPKLQILITGILRSLPSMGYIALLMGLIFYCYAVLGVFLFRGNDPGHFGSLGQALTTLLRVVTLEDWTDVMYTAYHGSLSYPAQGPIPVGPEPHAFGYWGILYFASFVVVGSMVMLNLFIGVVLTSLTEAHADQLERAFHPQAATDQRAELAESVQRMEAELKRLRQQLTRPPDEK